MHWLLGLICAIALACGSQAADSTVYQDPETGFKFSSYNAPYAIGRTITFRIAVPSGVALNTSYDAVIQVIAPTAIGWTGLAWGGRMPYNPLSVCWGNGNTPVVSSRWATGHVTPAAYPGASYQVFKTGTRANSSHWQYTAKCTGCTSFVDSTNRIAYINPAGNSNRLAFAYSGNKPASPASNTSSFGVHEVANYWYHDFAASSNANFDALVAKNL